MEVIITILLFVLLFLFLIIGVPIAFAMILAGTFSIIMIDPRLLPQVVNTFMVYGTNGTLLVAPMFILMAEILVAGKFSSDLFSSIHKWFSRVRGSLPLSSVLAAAGFSSVSGSSTATVVTIARVSAPYMLEQNYDKKLVSGSIVTGGTLGILIPPSMAMIIYGIVTETSILKLFIGGVIPGIVLTLLLSVYIYIFSVINPKAAPLGVSYSWFDRFTSLKNVIPIALLCLLVIGSMYTGITTPTESASLGVVVALVVALVMKRLTWDGFKDALIRSAGLSTMIMFFVFGGMIFAFVVAYLGIPNMLLETISQWALQPWLVLLIVLLFLILLGMFMDPISIMILTLPIIFPVITSLGYDPIWFGIIVVITAELGLITPPIGLNLFVLKTCIPELDLYNDIIKGALPFILVLLLMIVILVAFPGLVTVLI